MDYDKTQIPEVYVKSRQLSPETQTLWTEKAATYFNRAGGDGAMILLDLGSGTGRFTPILADRLAADVIGVEPSERMREQAPAHPHVTYLAGSAESIPCGDGSFDAAFLSMILHHVKSIPDTCGELCRVLRPGGVVFIRTDLQECIDGVRTYDFFPVAKQIARSKAPTIAGLAACFEAAGFETIDHGALIQQIDVSLQAHYERMQYRGVSTLAAITDEQFAEGLEAMRKAAAVETAPAPVTEAIGFAVFGKPSGGTRSE